VFEKEIEMSNTFAKLGAISYVLWGILHLVAAYKVYLLGQTLDPGIIQARIYQDAWNLLIFAIFGIVVGIFLNWKNSQFGYWLNLIVISAVDIGFIATVLMPGYLPIIPGVIGPLLWILAIIFSTIAIFKSPQDKVYT
jgi:hypothetical protein